MPDLLQEPRTSPSALCRENGGSSWRVLAFLATALLHLSRWTAMYGVLFSSPSVGWLWVVPALRVCPDVPDGVPSHPHWVAAVSSAAEMTPHPQLHQSFHRQSESHCKMWLQMCLMLWLQARMARSGWGLADCAWTWTWKREANPGGEQWEWAG